MGVINDLIKWIVDVLFPKTCLGCDKEGKYICDNCNLYMGESDLICPQCNKSSFNGRTHNQCLTNELDGLISFWEYEGITKEILYNIKEKGNFDIISELIKKIFLTIRQDIPRFQDFLSFFFSKETHITYIPISLKKEKLAGFNCNKIIAEELGKTIKKKPIELLKIKDHSEENEEININEFEIQPKSEFIPKKLILINDLYETGTTMKNCCKVLKEKGVEQVWGLTLFRGV